LHSSPLAFSWSASQTSFSRIVSPISAPALAASAVAESGTGARAPAGAPTGAPAGAPAGTGAEAVVVATSRAIAVIEVVVRAPDVIQTRHLSTPERRPSRHRRRSRCRNR